MMWIYNPQKKPPRKLTSHQAAAWMRSYHHLLKFVNREGHARIPRRHKEGDCSLRAWVERQRAKWRDGKLLEEHRVLLDKVPGWEWGREGVAQMPVEEEPRHGGHEWNFIVLSDGYRTDMVYIILLGRGALPYGEAVTIAATEIYENEFNPKRHLREGGRTLWLVKRAIKYGLRRKKFDKPAPGLLRAVLRDAFRYIEEDWERCIRLCDFTGTETKEEMVQKVLEKAVELMGLDLSTVEDAQVSMERLNKVLTERNLT